jgi:hypothetical protein
MVNVFVWLSAVLGLGLAVIGFFSLKILMVVGIFWFLVSVLGAFFSRKDSAIGGGVQSVEDLEIEAEMKLEDETASKVKGIIDEMFKMTGESTSGIDYPKVRVVSSVGSQYNFKDNVLLIGKDKINSGDDIGEEIGHFLRHQIAPANEGAGDQRSFYERSTHEFFGFMGRRLLKNSESGKDLQWKEDKDTIGTKGEALAQLGTIKEKMDKLSGFANGSKVDSGGVLTPKFANLQIKSLESERDNILVHHRAYEAASRVPMEKIHNWKALFSMPDKEVRARFFGRKTEDMNLSGL